MYFLIYNLPDELLDIIFKYLISSKKSLLNKFFYAKYNIFLQNNFTYEKYNSFIRDIIRNDNNFIFNYKINYNINKWLNFKKYNYKNIIYENYINFLIYYCNKYSSNKCKNTIYNILNKTGIKKISLKNNKIKYTKWIK